MRGKKAASLAAAAQNEMGTAGVSISVPSWLPSPGKDENWEIDLTCPS